MTHLSPSITTCRAFSLVELAVVLVVIGLLTGGVLVAKNLIRNSDLQSTAVKAYELGAAMRNFRDTYNALPGDMTNATDMWGLAGGTTAANNATCNTVDSTTLADIRATCNGDGNGRTWINNTVFFEVFRAVQQLANAGMIQGKFTGVTGALDIGHGVAGTNLPKGPLPRQALAPISMGWRGGASSLFSGGVYDNAVMAGAQHTTRLAHGAIMSAREASQMDAKLDDGNPGSGNVVTGIPVNCTNAGSIGGFSYNTPEAFPTLAYLQTTTKSCYPIFRNL